MKLDNMKIKAGAIAGCLMAAVGAYKSQDSVESGKVGILTTFGKIERTVDPGLTFHWPWQKVTQLSLQSQTIDVPLEVYSKDSQLAPQNVLSLTFSLPRGSAEKVFREFGADFFHAVLRNPVENIFREAFGQRTADQIIAEREILNRDVSQRLASEFSSRGILFERLGISIKFNDSFNRAAEESAIARTKVNTAQQELARQNIEAQQVVVKATGQADASLKQKTAEAEGIIKTGEAENKVLSQKAALLRDNPGLVNLVTAEKWNGVLPTTMIPNAATPLLQLDLK